MPNLLVDIAPTGADSSDGTFNEISGFTGTFTPASGSVLLLIATVPIQFTDTDQAVDVQFYNGSSLIGPVMTLGYGDNGADDEGGYGTMMYAVDGVAASEQTFAVHWKTRGAAVSRDTTRTSQFQVIELLDAEADLKIDLSPTGSATAGAYGAMTGMSGSYTPASQAGSVHLMIANFNITAGADVSVNCRMAVGGTREGWEITQGSDATNEQFGTSLVWATSGQAESNQTFALHWEDRAGSSNTVDTSRQRTFQVIELHATTIAADDTGTTDSVTNGSWTDIAGLTEATSINDSGNVVLMLAHIAIQMGGGDANTDVQFHDGTSRVGPVACPVYADDVGTNSNGMVAHALAGVTGSPTLKVQWNGRAPGAAALDTTNQITTFQVLEFSTAGPVITDAGDELFYDGETGITITGTNFGGTTGKVYISDNSTLGAAGTYVQLEVNTWADTSISVDMHEITTINAISDDLELFKGPKYLIVEDSSTARSDGWSCNVTTQDHLALNTDGEIDVDVTHIICCRVSMTGEAGATAFRWSNNHNSGGESAITTSSSNVKAIATAAFADGTDAAEILTGADTYITDNNGLDETGTFTLTAAMQDAQAFNAVLAFQIVGADVSDAQTGTITIELNSGTRLDTYTQDFTYTVNKAAAGSGVSQGTLHHISMGIGDPGVSVVPQTFHPIDNGIVAI